MIKPLLPLAFTVSVLLTACGGSSSSAPTAVTPSDNQSPKVEAVIGKNLGMNLDLSKLKSSGIAADKVVVKITKGDFTRTIETAHTDYAASVEFSGLTVGEYAISVQIFDGETLVAEGSGTGAVNANQTTTVNMDLELKSGGLVVNINISEPVEVLNIAKTVVTTTEKLEGGPIEASGLLGGTVADAYLFATYNHEAAYTKLEKGSELEVNFEISFNATDADELDVISEGTNTLDIKYNNLTLASCSECTTRIEKDSSILTINYDDVDIPEDVAASLVDKRTGDAIDIIPPVLLTERFNITVTFTRVNEEEISLLDIKNETLLDESEYQIQLAIESENCLNYTTPPGLACVNLGQLLSN